jgi:hypothetical protein
MQLWEAKAVRVELDATQWSQLRSSAFELCLESNWKRNTVKSLDRFGQLSGGAKANSTASTTVLPGSPFPNRILETLKA